MVDPQNQLQMPAGAAPAPDAPVIHVIPEQFYGAAIKQKVKEEPKQVVVKSAPTAPPPGPPKPPPPPKTPSSAKRKKPWLAIAIVVLILVGGGVAAFWALRKPPATAVNTNQVAHGPTCGNGQCESGETTANCVADCPAPAPFCGDGRCDDPETADSCAGDCGPPPPACGNGRCEETETPDSCASDCAVSAPQPGKDSDADGLTDIEETDIYGSNPNNTNTDADSFVDLNEVLNLFDPAKPTPAKLADNPGIASFKSAFVSVQYPRSWLAKDEMKAADDGSVFFTAATHEFVQVLAERKEPRSQTLPEWFAAQNPGSNSAQSQVFKTRSGYDAIFSADRMTAYIDAGPEVYVVTYNLGDQTEIRYRVTFEMMVNACSAESPENGPITQ